MVWVTGRVTVLPFSKPNARRRMTISKKRWASR